MPQWRSTMPAIALLLAGMSVSPSLLMKLAGIQDGLAFILIMPVFAVCLLFRRRIRVRMPVVVVLVLQITMLTLLSLHHESSSKGLFLTAFTLVGVLIGYLAFENNLVAPENFVRAYVLLIAVILIFAAVSVVAAWTGIAAPTPVYDRGVSGVDGTIVYSVGLTLSNEIYVLGDRHFVRASGLFDEPGMLGIMVMLAILANAVVLDNRRYELLLVVLGLFSGSLGYAASVLLFLVLWRPRVAAVVCLIFVFAGILGIFAIPESPDETLLFNRTVGRILLLIGPDYFGGNRAGDTVAGLQMLWDVGLLGLNERQLANYDIGSIAATFFGPFVFYGLAGGAILYLHVFLLGASGMFRQRAEIGGLFGNNLFRVFLVVGSSLYHRPSCLYFLYYLVLLAIYAFEQGKVANARVAETQLAAETRSSRGQVPSRQ